MIPDVYIHVFYLFHAYTYMYCMAIFDLYWRRSFHANILREREWRLVVFMCYITICRCDCAIHYGWSAAKHRGMRQVRAPARRGGGGASAGARGLGRTTCCLLLMESGAINARPRYDLFATHSPWILSAINWLMLAEALASPRFYK